MNEAEEVYKEGLKLEPENAFLNEGLNYVVSQCSFLQQVEALKKKGNDAMQGGDFDGAVQFYSDAIDIDPNNHVLFSNRCAAYMKKEKYDEALQDAESTIELKSDWVKVTPPLRHPLPHLPYFGYVLGSIYLEKECILIFVF